MVIIGNGLFSLFIEIKHFTSEDLGLCLYLETKPGWKLILIPFYSILYFGTSEVPEAILSIIHESKIQLSVKLYTCIFLLFSFMKFTSFKRLSRLGCLTSSLKSTYQVHNN
jgi:hypothetical protein